MIDIGLGHYLTLGAIIFTIGVVGIFLNRKKYYSSFNEY
jgi:NADH-quinone oxidoreductase subunit K